jgi:hypothetical protein
MRTIYFLFFGAIVALFSCSSAYKSAQTPDDVYYSPGNQKSAVANSNNTQDQYYNANPNDQYLMMRVQDPNRWSAFDSYDYDYGFSGYYNPYSYGNYGMYGGFYPGIGMGVGYGYWNPYYSYINSYYAWNSFYNPYYGGVIVANTKYYPTYNPYSQVHPFNFNTYTNTAVNNSNKASRFYTPSASGNNFRRLYNNQNSNNNSNFRQGVQPSRSYSPSSFGGGSGGGRSFGRPGRG